MSLIYIVEDDENIREIELYTLKNSGFHVESFETGSEMFKRIDEKRPSLIILDIMLPNEDGLEILTKIRQTSQFKKIPVIMVTAKSTEIDKVRGLDIGADDYITKPFGIMEFVSRIKALLRRVEPDEISSYSLRGISLDTKRRTVTSNGEKCELTYKEFDLLKYLLNNCGIVLSRDQIMNSVWGFDYSGESRTVDMHIKTLRQKLKENGGLIRTVRNVGYVIE